MISTEQLAETTEEKANLAPDSHLPRVGGILIAPCPMCGRIPKNCKQVDGVLWEIICNYVNCRFVKVYRQTAIGCVRAWNRRAVV